MRGSLADSVSYINEIVGERLNMPDTEVAIAINSIRSHRVMPGVFGRYYKLVLAVQGGHDEHARRLFQQILDTVGRCPDFSVGLFTAQSIGQDQALYRDLIDPNPGLTPWLCSPSDSAGFHQRVDDSLTLIEVADPALAKEIRGIVVQVVGAAPFHGPNARPFGSVSSLMLWGLLILNMERYRTAADLIQGLVHEAAHLLLFAHSIEGPLVTNSIDERYSSPLRSDPRPMDGVFHATFVSARMHYVNRKLREATSAKFAPVAIDELDRRLSTLRMLYFGGLKTVREHAKLTEAGQKILEESLDYMNVA
jgi:hypothetical protein